MSETAVVALITAVTALVGALGGQWISARTAIRLKQTELVFTRRVDAYRALLEHAAYFAISPREESRYIQFLGSLKGAVLVASPEVAKLLDGPRTGTLSDSAGRLRFSESDHDIVVVQAGAWHRSMEQVAQAMQQDVNRALNS